MSINYAELEDMEFYNENYKKEDWEFKTEQDFMDWYNENNIALDVTTWVRLNNCKEEMTYKDAFSNQICFIRDEIGDMFFKSPEIKHGLKYGSDEYKKQQEDLNKYWSLKQRNIKVDSTHMSKSILLPVYRIYADGKSDLVVTISDNFHGYQVSVESKLFGIDLDFSKLFDINSVPTFMYGFKNNRIFKSYSESNRRFSFYINNKYHLYMIMYQISELWKLKIN